MNLARLWGLVALIGIGAGAQAQETPRKIDIRPWTVPGQYEATIEMAMDQSMTVDGQPQPKQHMEQTLVARIAVGPRQADGDRVIEIAYTRIKQEVKRGAETLSYDSAGEPAKQNQILAEAYRPLLEIHIKVVLGPDGQVKSVTGLEEFWKKLEKKNPGAAETFKDMHKQMGDQLVKELITNTRDLLPPGGVALGQQWQTDKMIGVPFVGEVKLVQDCELTKVEQTSSGEVAVIDYKGKMTLPKRATVVVGVVKLEFTSFQMNQNGQLLYHIDTGTADASLTQEAKMDMTGKDERGKSIEMGLTQEGTVKTTTRKLGAATTTAPAAEPATQPAP